jgi:hypothetical protein
VNAIPASTTGRHERLVRVLARAYNTEARARKSPRRWIGLSWQQRRLVRVMWQQWQLVRVMWQAITAGQRDLEAVAEAGWQRQRGLARRPRRRRHAPAGRVAGVDVPPADADHGRASPARSGQPMNATRSGDAPIRHVLVGDPEDVTIPEADWPAYSAGYEAGSRAGIEMADLRITVELVSIGPANAGLKLWRDAIRAQLQQGARYTAPALTAEELRERARKSWGLPSRTATGRGSASWPPWS